MTTSLNDVFQFKVPIPSTLVPKDTGRLPLRSQFENSSSDLKRDNNYPHLSKSNSIWSGSPGRKIGHRFLQNGSKNRMPPPQAARQLGLPQSTLNDESSVPNRFFNNQVVHSTPLHKPLSLLRPPTASSTAVDNWSALGSSYRGSESVWSLTSNCNDNVDKLFRNALMKLLQKTKPDPENEELIIQVANELKSCAQEAALELGQEDGSVRSHYSKHAATWRSGMSVFSDKSQDTFQSLIKNRKLAPRARKDTSPAKSIQCSMERSHLSKRTQLGRITEGPAESDFTTTYSVIEKEIHPKKRAHSPDTNQESEPQTIRRRLNNDENVPVTTAVEGFEDDTSAADVEKKIFPKGTKPTLVDALLGIVGVLDKDDDDAADNSAFVRKIKGAKRKPPAKTKSPKGNRKTKKNDGKSNASISISAVAILTVTCTRSGRNVKKPSFYQVPEEKVRVRKPPSAANKSTEKPTNDCGGTEKNDTQAPKPARKPAVRKTAKPIEAQDQPIEEPVPVVLTKRGRAVKPTAKYGAIKMLTPSPCVTGSSRSKSEDDSNDFSSNKKTTKKDKNPPQSLENQPTATEFEPIGDDDGELSMSGIDFFIPEATQSTRRGVNKGRLATERALGANTPPLLHFTQNLNADIMASASNTGRTTPDWHPSQRTEKEALQIQKRKARHINRKQKKKKKVEKAEKPPKPPQQPKRPKSTNQLLKIAQKIISDKVRSSAAFRLPADSEPED